MFNNELFKNQKFSGRSLIISKFCFRDSKSIINFTSSIIYLIIKKKKKIHINFFIIVILLIFGKAPITLKTNDNKKLTGFKYNIKISSLWRIVNLCLPLNENITTLRYKLNANSYKLTIGSFPIITEIDKIFEYDSNLLEFIQNYKIIFFFKTFSIK